MSCPHDNQDLVAVGVGESRLQTLLKTRPGDESRGVVGKQEDRQVDKVQGNNYFGSEISMFNQSLYNLDMMPIVEVLNNSQCE